MWSTTKNDAGVLDLEPGMRGTGSRHTIDGFIPTRCFFRCVTYSVKKHGRCALKKTVLDGAKHATAATADARHRWCNYSGGSLPRLWERDDQVFRSTCGGFVLLTRRDLALSF